jgi:hypothetical protein
VIAVEQQMTRDLAQHDKLAALVDKLLSGASGELSGAERRALADLGRFRGCPRPTAAEWPGDKPRGPPTGLTWPDGCSSPDKFRPAALLPD